MPRRRSYRPRRKMRARRRMVRKNPRTGQLRIVRKCPEILLTNSGVLGGYTVTDPTGNCMATSGVGIATGFLGTYDIPFSMKFSLNQVLNSGEIIAIADKYKLQKTVVRIYFNSNQVSVASPTTLPQLSYMTDADDAAIPATGNVLREKMGTKIKYFNNKNYLSITLYPKPTAEVFGSGVFTAYAPGYKGFLDCNSPQVEHYGLKGVLQNVILPASINQTGFKWDVTHHILARDLQ